MNDKVKIFALGGLDEHGKNMYVIEINNDIFVLEAGLKYPDKSSPGIDFIIPNHEYLITNKSRIKAYFISHGHDDQFGALPFIYKQAPAPIYTTKAAAMMLERFTRRVGVKDVKYEIFTIEPSSQHNIAGHKFTFFQTTHSAMHSFGIWSFWRHDFPRVYHRTLPPLRPASRGHLHQMEHNNFLC